MSIFLAAERQFAATADAIREKTGGTAALEWDADTGFAEDIAAISGGGTAALQALTADRNGVYTPPEGTDGFSVVTVQVPIPQHSPRCDQAATFDWAHVQLHWGWDDTIPTA